LNCALSAGRAWRLPPPEKARHVSSSKPTLCARDRPEKK